MRLVLLALLLGGCGGLDAYDGPLPRVQLAAQTPVATSDGGAGAAVAFDVSLR